MDAATLYMVLTMQDGTQSASTKQYPTMQACEAHVDFLHMVKRAHRRVLRSPSAIIAYRCEARRRVFRLAAYDRRPPEREFWAGVTAGLYGVQVGAPHARPRYHSRLLR
jgi:hypothetical protein